MRYMMLIYTRETEDGPSPEEAARLKAVHWAVMDDAARQGVPNRWRARRRPPAFASKTANR
jgi:hypothetical protein